MYDNVLYIIGNGFDRHHDVKSSYQDFANWLKKNNWGLYKKLSEVCKVDYLWKDFERALAYVNRDYFLNMGEVLLPKGWTEDDTYAELYYPQDYVRGEAENLWSDIVKWFGKWVCSVKWERESDKKKVRIDYEARFITFNYTPFLETKYGIPAENILYIHGKATDQKRAPIIGHDGTDTFDNWYKTAGKAQKRHYKGLHARLPEVEMMTESVEEFYSLSEKPVQEILKQNQEFISDLYDVKHIYVLGHSLGNVDIPYFKAINKANDCPEQIHWYVSYYSEEEKQKLEDIMRKRIISDGATLDMITLASIQAIK